MKARPDPHMLHIAGQVLRALAGGNLQLVGLLALISGTGYAHSGGGPCLSSSVLHTCLFSFPKVPRSRTEPVPQSAS